MRVKIKKKTLEKIIKAIITLTSFAANIIAIIKFLKS